jgi:hypothetical protein
MVVLEPARWVRLPGTTWEVMLHGKRLVNCGGIPVCRTGDPGRLGGWDLGPVLDKCYVRRALR